MKPFHSIRCHLPFALAALLSACATQPTTERATAMPPATSFVPLSEAVTSFGAVASDGWLYVCGGHKGERHEYSAEMVSGAFYRLNIAEGKTWETLPPTEPAQGAPLVERGGYIYRIGGMAAQNHVGEKNDLRSKALVARYDIQSREWQKLAPLPEARSSHDAAVVGNQLYVGGGWQLPGGTNKAKWHDTLLVLNLTEPRTQWRSVPQPFKRRGLAMAALGDRLYFIGGMDSDNNTTLAVDVFDITTGQWSSGPALPAAPMKGFGCSAIVQGGRLFVSGYKGDLYRLAKQGDTWELVGHLQHPRFFHRLVPAGTTQLLAVGGEGEDGKLSDLELLSPSPTPLVQKESEATLVASSTAAIPTSAAVSRNTKAGGVSDWPYFRGLNRDGISSEAGWQAHWPKEGPSVLWKTNVGRGLSSFAVVGERAYTIGNRDNTDTLFCLNAATGQAFWTHSYPCASTNHPMSIVPGGPGSTPTIANGRVFVLSREGDLLCLEAATGKLLWRKQVLTDFGGKRPVYGYACSPLVDEDTLYLDIGGDAGSTIALDANSGRVRWQTGKGEAGYSTPLLYKEGERKVLAVFKGEALVLLAATDGSELARFATTVRDWCNTVTPVRHDGRLFVSNTGKDGSTLLEWSEGVLKPKWQVADLGLLFQSGVAWNGCLLAFNDQKRDASEFRCLDLATGQTRWAATSIDKGTFMMADKKLIILTSKGELVTAQPTDEKLEIISRVQVLGGKCWVAPVLAHGRILCRSNTGDVACLNVSQ